VTNCYANLSDNELLETMDDYGVAHEVIHEAAKRLRQALDERGRHMSRTAVAQELGIKRSKVHQLEAKGLRLLRHHERGLRGL